MHTVILHASPKKKGGASRLLARGLRIFLNNVKPKVKALNNKRNYEEILALLPEIDVLVISLPLYVDSIPSHVLEFLTLAEGYCKARNCCFRLYVLSNCGFIEGRQNQIQLMQFQAWCKRSGMQWGGGIGIGGGTMLNALAIIYPIILGIFTLMAVISAVCNGKTNIAVWLPVLENLLIYLFLNCGVIYGLIKLTRAIRRRKTLTAWYTRIMVPSFLFIPVADIFMLLAAMANGKLFAMGKHNARGRQKIHRIMKSKS